MLFIFLFILSLLSYNEPFAKAQILDSDAGISESDNGCGFIPTLFRTTVSGGRSVYRDEIPWQAGIYSRRTEPYMQVCGGSVVSTRVVISAAHCFWSETKMQLPAEDFAVAAGKLYRPWNDKMDDETAQKSDILAIRIPPRYHGSTTNFQEDLALLILATPFEINKSLKTICLDFDYALDQKHLVDGNLGKVSGWGRTDENGKASPTLQVVYLPSVDVQRCYDSIDPIFRPAITSDKICAGNTTGGTAVCMGDSGGGLAFAEWGDEGARYYLRGVVSTAPKSVNDNLCNIYTYATFTHIIRHEHFIKEVIAEAAGMSPQSAQPSPSLEPLTPSPDKPLQKPSTPNKPTRDRDPTPGNQQPLFLGNQNFDSSGNQIPVSRGNQESDFGGNQIPIFGENQQPVFIGDHSQSTGTQPSVQFTTSYPFSSTQSNTGVTVVKHKWQSNPGLFQYYRYPQQEYHGNYHHRYHQRPTYPHHDAWRHSPHNQW